jgi:hypothetical protein
MGVPAIRTAVAAESETAVPEALAPWERALKTSLRTAYALCGE